MNIGSEVELFRVGEAYIDNAVLCYRTTGEFAGAVSLGDLRDTSLAGTLESYVNEKGLTGTTVKANEDNQIVFSGLESGVYLIMQREAQTGYLKITPFLVSLPMYSSEGGWDYDVDASPKVQPVPKDPLTRTVIKLWRDNNADERPDSITVQLLRDGEVYETVELSKENNWRYTWTGLNAYYQWTVVEVDVPEDYKDYYSSSGSNLYITNRADDYKPRRMTS